MQRPQPPPPPPPSLSPQPPRKRKRINFTTGQQRALCVAATLEIHTIEDTSRNTQAKKQKDEAWQRIQARVAEYSGPGGEEKGVPQLKNKWSRIKIGFITKFHSQLSNYIAGELPVSAENVAVRAGGDEVRIPDMLLHPGASNQPLDIPPDVFDSETMEAPTQQLAMDPNAPEETICLAMKQGTVEARQHGGAAAATACNDKMAEYLDKMAAVAELRQAKLRLRIRQLERAEKLAELRHELEVERLRNEATLALALTSGHRRST